MDAMVERFADLRGGRTPDGRHGAAARGDTRLAEGNAPQDVDRRPDRWTWAAVLHPDGDATDVVVPVASGPPRTCRRMPWTATMTRNVSPRLRRSL